MRSVSCELVKRGEEVGRREEGKEKSEIRRRELLMIKRREVRYTQSDPLHRACCNLLGLYNHLHTQGDSLGAALWLRPLFA